ncbi:MAG: hypothetical protein IT169_16310 [Bryobacterales bacterium]|nr:hypothetical protein [Bryobacterales bacterium]
MTQLQLDNRGPRGIEKWLIVSIGILLVAPFVFVLGMWAWNLKLLPFSGPSVKFLVERGEPGMRRIQAEAIPQHAARMEDGFPRCIAVRLAPHLPRTAIVRNFECSSGSDSLPPVFFRLSWGMGSAPTLDRLSGPDALADWDRGIELPQVAYSIEFGRDEAAALLERCRSNVLAAGASQKFEGTLESITGPGALFGRGRPRVLIGGPPGEHWMVVRRTAVTGSLRNTGWPDFSGLERPLWRKETTTTGVASCVSGQWSLLLHTRNWQEHPSFYRGGELHWLSEDYLLLTESTEPLRLLLFDLQATAAKPARKTP